MPDRSGRLPASGSSKKRIGGGCVKLLELGGPTISMAYKIAWERIYLDLTELARLRWIENWKIEKLAVHFEVSRTALKERLRAIKSNPKRAGINVKTS